MADFQTQFVKDYRLTTANIIYHMPDYPELLQEFIWQEYDIAPRFPELHRFLQFWTREIDGKIHSVYIASKEIVSASEMRFCEGVYTLQ